MHAPLFAVLVVERRFREAVQYCFPVGRLQDRDLSVGVRGVGAVGSAGRGGAVLNNRFKMLNKFTVVRCR